jgi:hypothetical protein
MDFGFEVKGKIYNNLVLETGIISPIDFLQIY